MTWWLSRSGRGPGAGHPVADDAGRAVKVLVVDDHEMFSQSLARLLSIEDDITVVGTATTGPIALEMVAELHPHVVLVDYQLPGQNGVSVVAEIKRLHPQVMAVMVTGLSDERILRAAVEAGCSGFLTKDQTADSVADAVRSAAAGEAVISPSLLGRLLPTLGRGNRDLGYDLTEREREVLVLLSNGLSNKAIATELHLSVNTIRNYVQSILTKLNVHSKLEAVSTGVKAGIIDYPSS